MSVNHRGHNGHGKRSEVAQAARKVGNRGGRAVRHTAHTAASEAGSIMDAVKELGSATGEAAVEGFDQMRNTAGEYIEQGREQIVSFEQSVEEYVREKPMKSLLMAMGAGCLLGMIWSRRG